MKLVGWMQTDVDGTMWQRECAGHYLSMSLEGAVWVGEIDSMEIVDSQPESAHGEYGAKMLARKMEHMAERMEPADPWVAAFHQEQFERLTEHTPHDPLKRKKPVQ